MGSSHCHSLSLASVKSRSVLPFWYRLTRVVPDKRLLNGCLFLFKHCLSACISRSDCANEPISEHELSTIFSDLCVPGDCGGGGGSRKIGFTTQLLLVYYVLLYEDTLLTNMASIGMTSTRKHLTSTRQ